MVTFEALPVRWRLGPWVELRVSVTPVPPMPTFPPLETVRCRTVVFADRVVAAVTLPMGEMDMASPRGTIR
jgi:hypothetical protein